MTYPKIEGRRGRTAGPSWERATGLAQSTADPLKKAERQPRTYEVNDDGTDVG